MVNPEKTETVEAVLEGEEQAYIYEDEIEDARIQKNYILLFENLLQTLERKEAFTLKEWQEQLMTQLGENVVKNADYYSFLVHLVQKKEYTKMQTLLGSINDDVKLTNADINLLRAGVQKYNLTW